MDLFQNAKSVRLRANNESKYLTADDDEVTVSQSRSSFSKNARWEVEPVPGSDNLIRFKSCYGKYLTASNQPFLLGMTGHKVLQSKPSRLDSSLEWEPIRTEGSGSQSTPSACWVVEPVPGSDNLLRFKSCYGKYLTASNQPFLLGMTGHKVVQSKPSRIDSSLEWEPIRGDGNSGSQVRLRTRYGHFLKANGGLPPWRNSVTHDIPHRTSTQDILWEVHVVDIIVRSPHPKPDAGRVEPIQHSDSNASDSSYSRQESNDSLVYSPPKAIDGRTIYYHIADTHGNIDDGEDGLCITFKGNNVEELTRKLEEETGLDSIVVCSRSPLNNKLYPLRLQLPPNNATMQVVVVDSSSKAGRDVAKTGVL